jgi:hypothetical protein
MVDIMAEQMAANVQIREPPERESSDAAQVEAGAGAAVAPIPQSVAAPGINAGSPIVRTEVLPEPPSGDGRVAVGRPSKGRTYSLLLVGGYVSALVGFALVFVAPRFKSGLAGKSLLIVSGVLLVAGAVAVSLGFVRETMRRL